MTKNKGLLGFCAAIYAFSQGDTVPLDNQF